MSQSPKRIDGKPAISKAADISRRRRRTGFIIGAVVITIILVILGVGYYQSYISPFQRIIITVDGTSIRIDYFIKRTRMAGATSISMLEALTSEQIIKIKAPSYGIAVSPEEVTQELRTAARGSSTTISESEFQAWYRQQLNESKLSDAEFKEIVATSLLAARLQEYLAERVPTVAEQVHLYDILVNGYQQAQDIKARVGKGEAFADLAREVSLDEQSKAGGGDLGWVPRGVLAPQLNSIIFALNPGEVSAPVPTEAQPTEGGPYLLLMVSEKVDAKELDENSLQMLKTRALGNWLVEERQFHQVTYNFTSETAAWINWQLSKNNPSATGQTPTP
ncbi:MAG: peptidylprolyl isomerase [Chloroflexi bacterium]|nr:peptidylprolyl isomerase [Chloroflexota bacterium]